MKKYVVIEIETEYEVEFDSDLTVKTMSLEDAVKEPDFAQKLSSALVSHGDPRKVLSMMPEIGNQILVTTPLAQEGVAFLPGKIFFNSRGFGYRDDSVDIQVDAETGMVDPTNIVKKIMKLNSADLKRLEKEGIGLTASLSVGVKLTDMMTPADHKAFLKAIEDRRAKLDQDALARKRTKAERDLERAQQILEETKPKRKTRAKK